jgi:hypothetical protein
METGIYYNIPAKEYHSWNDIVSNSYLGRLSKVPAAAKIPQDETEAMKFGRAFHTWVLEGEAKLWDDFIIPESFPTKPNKRSTQKTVDTYNKWLQELNGKQPITYDDFETIMAMNASVKAHPSASKFLEEGVSETTLIWTDEETGLQCKARPDRIPSGNKGVILDLKSTISADDYSFQSDCVKYGYAREAAIYLEGFGKLTGALYQDLIFALIAVEKTEPYRVECYTIESDFLQWGWGEFHRLLQIEKECRDKNFWPSYKNAGVSSLFKPAYLKVWEWEAIDRQPLDYKRGDEYVAA